MTFRKRSLSKPLVGDFTLFPVNPGINRFYQRMCLRSHVNPVSDLKKSITVPWETQWLNEFTQHQSSNQMITVAVEKEFVASFYHNLNDNLRMNFFLNPDDKEIQFNISESTVSVVIKRLVTRALIDKLKTKKAVVSIATLEKIMIDLIADAGLFHFYQGSEMIHIYEMIIDRYNINFKRLFNYAKRRRKEQDIKQLISNYIPIFLDK